MPRCVSWRWNAVPTTHGKVCHLGHITHLESLLPIRSNLDLIGRTTRAQKRGYRQKSTTSLFVLREQIFSIAWVKNKAPSSNLRDEGAFFDSLFKQETYLALQVVRRGHFLKDALKIFFILEFNLNLVLTFYGLNTNVSPKRAAQRFGNRLERCGRRRARRRLG